MERNVCSAFGERHDNRRNGRSKKTVVSEYGDTELLLYLQLIIGINWQMKNGRSLENNIENGLSIHNIY